MSIDVVFGLAVSQCQFAVVESYHVVRDCLSQTRLRGPILPTPTDVHGTVSLSPTSNST